MSYTEQRASVVAGFSRLRLTAAILSETFDVLRNCGRNERECHTLWLGPWSDQFTIDEVVHPLHQAIGDGFVVDESWLRSFWVRLAKEKKGVRAQVHTHPQRAFHSPTDDEWPIVSSPGFLSLVIPRFAMGPVGFAGAYLAEVAEDGQWLQVKRISDRLEIVR